MVWYVLNKRGRREGENDESSGKVKLVEVGERRSGGVGAKVVAREGGRGKKEGLKRERGGRGGGEMFTCMVSGDAGKEVGALVKFTRSIAPGARRESEC